MLNPSGVTTKDVAMFYCVKVFIVNTHLHFGVLDMCLYSDTPSVSLKKNIGPDTESCLGFGLVQQTRNIVIVCKSHRKEVPIMKIPIV